MPRSDVDGDTTSVHSFTTQDTAASSEAGGRRPKKYKFYKRFAYQKLNGWRPILSPRIAEIFFTATGVLLLALGIPILIASLNVVEYSVPYGYQGPFASLDADARQNLLWSAPDATGVQYPVNVLVDKRMEPPIYIVYELAHFYQNFRRYVRSYDPKRMHDGADAGSPASACNPFTYLGGNDSLPINPCGQIAANFFNDSFAVMAGGTELPIDDSDIAWSSDEDHLYGPVSAENYNPGDKPALRTGNTTTLVLNENQHWMVWMRPHSQIAVQKLYGKINTPIEAGTNLTIMVNNRYNTYGFNGAKTVIVTTNSWVGGKNNFLGIVYIVVGSLCLLDVLFFFVGYDLGLIWKRSYGDMANLSWLRQHAAEIHAQQQFAASSSSARSVGGNGEMELSPQDHGDADGVAAATLHTQDASKN